jgi:hypothetical protein
VPQQQKYLVGIADIAEDLLIYYSVSELKVEVAKANLQPSSPYEYVGFSGETESIRRIVSPK